jgi:hypothetical protein
VVDTECLQNILDDLLRRVVVVHTSMDNGSLRTKVLLDVRCNLLRSGLRAVGDIVDGDGCAVAAQSSGDPGTDACFASRACNEGDLASE